MGEKLHADGFTPALLGAACALALPAVTDQRGDILLSSDSGGLISIIGCGCGILALGALLYGYVRHREKREVNTG